MEVFKYYKYSLTKYFPPVYYGDTFKDNKVTSLLAGYTNTCVLCKYTEQIKMIWNIGNSFNFSVSIVSVGLPWLLRQ